MRCVIPSVSKVSLANIILLTLFVGSSFGLGFCFALCITRVASAIEELFVAAILRFPKGRHYLEWNLSWSYHNPFRATLPTSLLITQSWRNRGVNETNKKIFTVCGHELILKGFLLPSIAPFKYLFFSTWVPFLLSFTIILK